MNGEEVKKQLSDLKRGCEEIIPGGSFEKNILDGKRLTVKFGVDPTAPELHLGHTVVMEKLKTFQKYGHKILLIIGDFTAAIGDPSGRSVQRPLLSEGEIKKNVKSFKSQLFNILEKRNIEIVHNSSWLGKLGAEGIIKLSSHYTVARMLERNDFSQRYESGNAISITEFLYPLLQGYDSFEIEADLEIGGTDQKFNLLVGREIQKSMGQNPQVIMTMPLLEGTDGVRKMSKSYGNHIGVNEEPSEMFGKVMSISDDAMVKYYRLLTMDDVEEVKKMHPMEAKKSLAWQLVAKYHGPSAAGEAREGFEKVFSRGKVPDQMEEYKIKGSEKITDIITSASLSSSRSGAKRLIKQGAVELDGQKIKDISYTVSSGGVVLKVGKRGFLKLL